MILPQKTEQRTLYYTANLNKYLDYFSSYRYYYIVVAFFIVFSNVVYNINTLMTS